jgi:SAM-dependent methyltransferase
MQEQFESHYHNIESSHWWFVARRQAVHDVMVKIHPGSAARILEIGCSGGLLMEQLRREGFGQVQGIDISEAAIELCGRKGLSAQVMDAQRPTLPDASFDFVIASDVLEHLADDIGALREWRRILKPGGSLLVFVPAFMFLWTAHDVANRHHRRYRAPELNDRMRAAGFIIQRSCYWLAFLFPAIVLVRVVKLLMAGGKLPADGGHGDAFVPPRAINQALLGLVRLENMLLRLGVNWPLGVSVMALARNPEVMMDGSPAMAGVATSNLRRATPAGAAAEEAHTARRVEMSQPC